MPTNLAIFVSGTGSNARVLIDRLHAQSVSGARSQVRVAVVVSNREDAPALMMAAERGVPTLVLRRQSFRETEALVDELAKFDVRYLVLAGFLWLIPPYLVRAFPDRILNIHPALLPKYGGKGMYGLNVHRAVKAAGELESGITIHLINERYDEGRVLFQAAGALDAGDTAEEIGGRVLRLEHGNYWRVVLGYIGEYEGK